MQVKIGKTLLILGIVVVLIGLALLAYIGIYNRYWSDDWCYNRDFKTMGVLGALRGYVDFPGGYSSNRYSLTLFSGILYLFGLPGTQAMTALLMALWLGGLYWNFRNLSHLSIPIPPITLLLASSLLLYYVLYLSPQRFQILYWRAGVMPYSAAIVSGLYIFAIITGQMLAEKTSKTLRYFSALLAFLAGGFSEISCVLLVTALGLLFLWAGWSKQRGKAWAIRSFPVITIALFFLVLSMLALILAPANARVEDVKIVSTNPLMVPWLSLQAAAYFVFNSLKTLPLPHFIFILIFGVLPVLFRLFQEQPASIKHPGLCFVVVALVSFLLLVAIHAPTIYFYSAPPDPRGQSLGRFVMLSGLALLAWLAGDRFSRKWSNRWILAGAALVLLAGFAYTARTISTVYAELPGYISRAQQWDVRDLYIRSAQAEGIRLLEVRMIDTAAIDTRDLLRSKSSDREGWSRSCAAEYYGLDGMKPLAP